MNARILILVYVVGCLTIGSLASCGSVGDVGFFQNTCGIGKDYPIFGVNPSDSFSIVRGNPFDPELFKDRTPLVGERYSAELWYGLGDNAPESSLQPVQGSLTKFLPVPLYGLFRAPGRVTIPNTLGGDHVTLQIRVWDNRNGVIGSWAAVLADDSVPRGTSSLITAFELNGFDALGNLHAPGTMSCRLRDSFGLYIVPEPDCLFWLCLTFVMGVRKVR